jgi:hypothetical protein
MTEKKSYRRLASALANSDRQRLPFLPLEGRGQAVTDHTGLITWILTVGE